MILTTSAFAISAGLASPALAQGAAGDPPDPACANLPEGDARDKCISGEVEIESGQAATEAEGTIVVTGSRIRRPNLDSPVPITSVSAEELTAQGDVNVGDALNDLPSLRTTFSQANSTRFIGTTGLNVLDLRGLGTSRTLVLVNGRRHITASPGDYEVDVNTIPTDLLERVDVITGGSSAVYGSDAVAGVVNFITKRNFEGLRARGQAGASSRGDRGIQFLSLTGGKNLFDDRANVAINLEYVNADPLYFHQRPRLTGSADGRCQFNAAEPAGGEPLAGDGVPDQNFYCGVRTVALSTGGTVAPAGVTAAICSNPTVLANPTLAARCLQPGTPLGQPRIFRFDPAGSLLQDIPSLDFRPFGSGNYLANPNSPVLGTTLLETGQLTPGLDRYMANVLAHFDVSDAFKPFVEAKYVHIKSLQEFQPSFFQNFGFRCNNAFVTPQALAALQAIGRCANPATGTFPVSRFSVDLGGRIEETTRETYRIVGGVEGQFNTDWRYEVALNYGHFRQRGKHHNDLQLADIDGNPAGFSLAVDAARDAGGNIVCAVNADANPANDAPGCIPINLFGHGAPSQAAIDYVNVTSRLNQKASQLNAVAYVNGDFSQLFEFPGGPARFVVGGEYRKETAYYKADPLSAADATFFNAFSEFDPPPLKVKDLFGEIELPILRDAPFFHELTLTAAGRQSWYNKGAGSTKKSFAYNVNGVWAPVRDLRFRGNYSKSVRVPTLSDLFTPPTQNFAQLLDPCDVSRIGPPGTNRFDNCAALGVPAGFVAVVSNSQTAEIISSGNPFLTEETGKSLTLGGVFTPRWVPGLSLSVDYYRIRVNNLIATLGGQTILNQCVDLPDTNNQFCQLIFPRQTVDDPSTAFSEVGALADPALISGGVNFASQEADGIDFEATYRKNFSNGHRLNLHGIATLVLKRNNYLDPLNPDFRDVQLGELGDPKWAAFASLGYGFGPIDLRYSLNYIGKSTIGVWENYFAVQDRPAQNADLTRERFRPPVLYHAIRTNFRVPATGKDKFNFYFGVDNIFDTKPPFGLLGTGAGDPYDGIGRYFYAGATVNF